MDGAAFESLFAATRGPLLAYLRHAAGQEATAEDLLQEAYIRLLNHPPRTTDPKALRCWLFTTATRLLKDHWRRERPWAWLPWERDGGDGQEPAAEAPLQDHLAWTQELVREGLRALTPRQRSLVWLAHVEGFDHGELASALGLTPGSARVLLHRARQRMNETLRTLGGTP
jgi:RNA polymerase sigma-70 factor (ECF subfamily)